MCSISGFVWADKNVVEQRSNSEDISYKLALFDYYQDDYFQAITDLLVAEKNISLLDKNKKADILIGGLYHSYGLNDKAAAIFKRLTGSGAEYLSTNDLARVWFYLGRSYFEEDNYDAAGVSLLSIDGNSINEIDAEWLYMLSAIYIRDHKYEDALELIKQFPEESIWNAYAKHNLGIKLSEHQKYEGITLLKDLSDNLQQDKEYIELRDSANLALASLYVGAEKYEQAIEYFNNVGSNGLSTNHSLLGMGWSYYRLSKFDKAKLYWRELVSRSDKDAAVYEALLLLPLMYEKQGKLLWAHKEYDNAVNVFDKNLKALEKLDAYVEKQGVVHMLLPKIYRLQQPGEAEELTSVLREQLLELIASDQFNQLYRNYLELLQLDDVLAKWAHDIPSLEIIVKEKIDAFNNRLTDAIATLENSHSETLKHERNKYVNYMKQIKLDNSGLSLATDKEQEMFRRLNEISSAAASMKESAETGTALMDRAQFLKGLLSWDISTDYATRLRAVDVAIQQLDGALLNMESTISSLKNAMQYTPDNHVKYKNIVKGKKEIIQRLRADVAELQLQVEAQAKVVTRKFIAVLRERLKTYRDQAGFGKIKAYDKLLMQSNNENK